MDFKVGISLLLSQFIFSAMPNRNLRNNAENHLLTKGLFSANPVAIILPSHPFPYSNVLFQCIVPMVFELLFLLFPEY